MAGIIADCLCGSAFGSGSSVCWLIMTASMASIAASSSADISIVSKLTTATVWVALSRLLLLILTEPALFEDDAPVNCLCVDGTGC